MKETSIFNTTIRAVNIGARLLGEALQQQKTDVVMLNWHPPKEVKLSPEILKIQKKME